MWGFWLSQCSSCVYACQQVMQEWPLSLTLTAAVWRAWYPTHADRFIVSSHSLAFSLSISRSVRRQPTQQPCCLTALCKITEKGPTWFLVPRKLAWIEILTWREREECGKEGHTCVRKETKTTTETPRSISSYSWWMENEPRRYVISSDVLLHPCSASCISGSRWYSCYGVGRFSESEYHYSTNMVGERGGRRLGRGLMKIWSEAGENGGWGATRVKRPWEQYRSNKANARSAEVRDSKRASGMKRVTDMRQHNLLKCFTLISPFKTNEPDTGLSLHVAPTQLLHYSWHFPLKQQEEIAKEQFPSS